MSSKHVCLVPKEWGTYYDSNTLEVILKKEISCEQITKKVEGIGIHVEGVTAYLRYHNQQPWMRKDQDKRTWPNHREYFGVYMSCNKCRKPDYRKYKTIDGIEVNIQGVTAYLQYYNEEFWLRKCQDQRSKPDPKQYYPVYMPCIYCTESNNLLYRRN